MITSRSYAGPDDLQVMLALIKDRPPERIPDFPGIVDLREMLGVPQIQKNARLWFSPSGIVAGFAILDVHRDSAMLIMEIAPSDEVEVLIRQIVGWAEAILWKLPVINLNGFSLEIGVRSDDLQFIALLESLAFKPQTPGGLHMERPLKDPIPKPIVPSGFIIRPGKGDAEAEAWVHLHRAAHGTDVMTTAYRLEMLRTPDYDPDLDLVALTSDGTLAAYCVCHVDVEENSYSGQNIGYTDPVATHPEFQRRGLSKALLLTGLALLKQRGMEIARLGTASDNTAMIQAARSAGFHVTGTNFSYAKPAKVR